MRRNYQPYDETIRLIGSSRFNVYNEYGKAYVVKNMSLILYIDQDFKALKRKSDVEIMEFCEGLNWEEAHPF